MVMLYVDQCGVCAAILDLGSSPARHGDLDQTWARSTFTTELLMNINTHHGGAGILSCTWIPKSNRSTVRSDP